MNEKPDIFKANTVPLPYAMDAMVICDRTDDLLDDIHARAGCEQMELQAASVIRTAMSNVAIHIAARMARGAPTYSIRDFVEPIIAHVEHVIDQQANDMKQADKQQAVQNLFGFLIGRLPPPKKK